jgi:hypothetical protein
VLDWDIMTSCFQSKETVVKLAIAAASWILASGNAGAQTFDELTALYRYDRSAPLDIRQTEMGSHAGYKLSSISYALPKVGRISGYLVSPDGEGRKPAIVWMHSGGPIEYLGNAILMAKAGAVSLLVGKRKARPEEHRSKPGIS